MSIDALTIPQLEQALGARIDRESLRALDPHGDGMSIDKAFLEREIASLHQQRDAATRTAFQAEGAIQAYEALVAKLDQEAAEQEAKPE